MYVKEKKWKTTVEQQKYFYLHELSWAVSF